MGTAGLIEFNWGLVFILLNVIILFLILRKFFFEKVMKFMEQRENGIRDAFAGAEAINKKADEKMENYNRQIADLEDKGRELIREAKQKADAQAGEIISEAHEKAGNMLVAAEKQIEMEKERALNDMKQQVAVLAMLAAEKIIEKNIEMSGQEQIVDEILEQTGSSIWKN